MASYCTRNHWRQNIFLHKNKSFNELITRGEKKERDAKEKRRNEPRDVMGKYASRKKSRRQPPSRN